MKSRWTPELTARVVSLYESGLAPAQIAREMGPEFTATAIATKLSPYTWSAARIARLQELAALGWSSPLIADDLGVSKSAVMGKMHRLGMTESAGSRKPSVCRAPVARFPFRKSRQQAAPSSAPEFLCVTLMDLSANQCRFPRGGDNGEPILFCGQPRAEGSSYCAWCSAIVFRPIQQAA